METAKVSHMGVWLFREAVLTQPEMPAPPGSESPVHAVPEPTSWALMMTGMLGLWGLRRRRSARQPLV
ncbi:MAG: PEP-CTERM sorting domain-containing protein [Gammaproteobacteria bacterium]|nr:PEP-CTERM sorting domain-containing protein [Gammaproteobacteria bacterium]